MGDTICENTRKAAEQGYAFYQCVLGDYYRYGTGVPKDDAEALKWYRKAAEQGDAHAQLSLGSMYAEGEGVPKDRVEAYVWFNLAGPTLDKAGIFRDDISRFMTLEQIAEAQKRSRAFVAKPSPVTLGIS